MANMICHRIAPVSLRHGRLHGVSAGSCVYVREISIIDMILRDNRRFAHVSGDSVLYAGRGMVILW